MDAHGAAAAENGHAVGDLHDLVQLVADEDDGITVLLQVDQLPEQLGGFLGGQYGGGLVQDQDLGAAHQRLQDLYLLLHTHGDVHHLGGGVHVQVKALGIFLREFHGFFLINK